MAGKDLNVASGNPSRSPLFFLLRWDVDTLSRFIKIRNCCCCENSLVFPSIRASLHIGTHSVRRRVAVNTATSLLQSYPAAVGRVSNPIAELAVFTVRCSRLAATVSAAGRSWMRSKALTQMHRAFVWLLVFCLIYIQQSGGINVIRHSSADNTLPRSEVAIQGDSAAPASQGIATTAAPILLTPEEFFKFRRLTVQSSGEATRQEQPPLQQHVIPQEEQKPRYSVLPRNQPPHAQHSSAPPTGSQPMALYSTIRVNQNLPLFSEQFDIQTSREKADSEALIRRSQSEFRIPLAKLLNSTAHARTAGDSLYNGIQHLPGKHQGDKEQQHTRHMQQHPLLEKQTQGKEKEEEEEKGEEENDWSEQEVEVDEEPQDESDENEEEDQEQDDVYLDEEEEEDDEHSRNQIESDRFREDGELEEQEGYIEGQEGQHGGMQQLQQRSRSSRGKKILSQWNDGLLKEEKLGIVDDVGKAHSGPQHVAVDPLRTVKSQSEQFKPEARHLSPEENNRPSYSFAPELRLCRANVENTSLPSYNSQVTKGRTKPEVEQLQQKLLSLGEVQESSAVASQLLVPSPTKNSSNRLRNVDYTGGYGHEKHTTAKREPELRLHYGNQLVGPSEEKNKLPFLQGPLPLSAQAADSYKFNMTEYKEGVQRHGHQQQSRDQRIRDALSLYEQPQFTLSNDTQQIESSPGWQPPVDAGPFKSPTVDAYLWQYGLRQQHKGHQEHVSSSQYGAEKQCSSHLRHTSPFLDVRDINHVNDQFNPEKAQQNSSGSAVEGEQKVTPSWTPAPPIILTARSTKFPTDQSKTQQQEHVQRLRQISQQDPNPSSHFEEKVHLSDRTPEDRQVTGDFFSTHASADCLKLSAGQHNLQQQQKQREKMGQDPSQLLRHEQQPHSSICPPLQQQRASCMQREQQQLHIIQGKQRDRSSEISLPTGKPDSFKYSNGKLKVQQQGQQSLSPYTESLKRLSPSSTYVASTQTLQRSELERNSKTAHQHLQQQNQQNFMKHEEEVAEALEQEESLMLPFTQSQKLSSTSSEIPSPSRYFFQSLGHQRKDQERARMNKQERMQKELSNQEKGIGYLRQNSFPIDLQEHDISLPAKVPVSFDDTNDTSGNRNQRRISQRIVQEWPQQQTQQAHENLLQHKDYFLPGTDEQKQGHHSPAQILLASEGHINDLESHLHSETPEEREPEERTALERNFGEEPVQDSSLVKNFLFNLEHSAARSPPAWNTNNISLQHTAEREENKKEDEWEQQQAGQRPPFAYLEERSQPQRKLFDQEEEKTSFSPESEHKTLQRAATPDYSWPKSYATPNSSAEKLNMLLPGSTTAWRPENFFGKRGDLQQAAYSASSAQNTLLEEDVPAAQPEQVERRQGWEPLEQEKPSKQIFQSVMSAAQPCCQSTETGSSFTRDLPTLSLPAAAATVISIPSESGSRSSAESASDTSTFTTAISQRKLAYPPEDVTETMTVAAEKAYVGEDSAVTVGAVETPNNTANVATVKPNAASPAFSAAGRNTSLSNTETKALTHLNAESDRQTSPFSSAKTAEKEFVLTPRGIDDAARLMAASLRWSGDLAKQLRQRLTALAQQHSPRQYLDNALLELLSAAPWDEPSTAFMSWLRGMSGKMKSKKRNQIAQEQNGRSEVLRETNRHTHESPVQRIFPARDVRKPSADTRSDPNDDGNPTAMSRSAGTLLYHPEQLAVAAVPHALNISGRPGKITGDSSSGKQGAAERPKRKAPEPPAATDATAGEGAWRTPTKGVTGTFPRTKRGSLPFLQQALKDMVYVLQWYTESVGATMNGMRDQDEDALIVHGPLQNFPDARIFSLFDGHAGKGAARHCASEASQVFGELRDFTYESIRHACLSLDYKLRTFSATPTKSGSTGVIALTERHVSPSGIFFTIHLANVGDSRAFLLRSDKNTYEILSRDHKPNHAEELRRIQKAGGSVRRSYRKLWRVNGLLALSRSFGDFELKNISTLPLDEQPVTAVPDVRTTIAQPGDYLFLGCDGVFEAQGMSWDFVARLLKESLHKYSGDLASVVDHIIDIAYSLGSRDNISIVVVHFSSTLAATPTIKHLHIKPDGSRQDLPVIVKPAHMVSPDAAGVFGEVGSALVTMFR